MPPTQRHIHPDTDVSVRFHFMTGVNGGQVQRTIKNSLLPGYLCEVKRAKCLFIVPSFLPICFTTHLLHRYTTSSRPGF